MLSPLTHDDPVAIGAYRLLARLGSGGMGTVYLARSAGGRTVALKTMHAGIASDPASRARFRLETDAARVIGRHHGAMVVDADSLAETPWLATEYVLGPPLDEAVALSGPLPESSVRALGAALAGALAQLHASDVVHRDLKPSNVMVTAYGPKIIDFGIARAAGDDRLTRTGAAAGTPAFMSPEQATGQEHTPAGDVFALAGVLTYAATGRGPFGSGQAADLLYRVRYADPDLTGVPDLLAPILYHCLSKEAGRRPTTSDLIAQLHHGQGEFADHLPDVILADIARRASEVWQYQPYRLQAPPESQDPSTVPSRISRRKLLSLAGGSVMGVAAAGAGAGAWMWMGRKGADDDAHCRRSPARTRRVRAGIHGYGPGLHNIVADARLAARPGGGGDRPPVRGDTCRGGPCSAAGSVVTHSEPTPLDDRRTCKAGPDARRQPVACFVLSRHKAPPAHGKGAPAHGKGAHPAECAPFHMPAAWVPPPPPAEPDRPVTSARSAPTSHQ